MNKKIVLPLALLAAGAIAYFLIKKKETIVSTTPPPTPLPLPLPPPTTRTNPFGTTQLVKDFQDWLDINHPNWVNGGKLNKGSGYGNFGMLTAAAYNSYGKDYAAALLNPILNVFSTLKVGDYVNAKNSTGAYTSNTMVKRYPMGNIEGILSGTLLKGYYAGQIDEIDTLRGSAKVWNSTYKARDNNEVDYSSYWLKLKDLEKK